MSNESFDNKGTDIQKPAKERRNFLVKASAGAIVASIPAKSVWATNTLTSGSMMGSLNGSNATGGSTPIVVKKPHEWSGLKNHDFLTAKYTEKCGRTPQVANELKNFLGSSNLHKLRFRHILGYGVKSFLQTDCGCEINSYNKLVMRDSHGNVYKTASMSTVRSWLKDNVEVNALVVSAYLNASFSGLYTYYPIVRSFSNPHAPFASTEEFLMHLHDARVSNYSNTASVLTQLHNNPNSV